MTFTKRVSLFAVSAMMALFLSVPVSALSESQIEFYALNNILFYDPTGSRECYSGNLTGGTSMAKVVSYLKGANPQGFVLSDNAIAGILASFEAESGFNPFRFEGDSYSGGDGYGIAQFKKDGILERLRTDPRTANYFDKYYDLKYSEYDPNTGYPLEPVPEQVYDAWLSVQLDYFFGPSSEFETVRVRDFRDSGGEMGLDYIKGNRTVHEAMDEARTPEDAARIFVWLMERSLNKEQDSLIRSRQAGTWVAYAQNLESNYGSNSEVVASDGSDVTIIGDELVLESEDAIKSVMPNVEIDAMANRRFYSSDSNSSSGIAALEELEKSGKLRDTVFYALGTNGEGITLEQAEEVVRLVGSDRKVVFVTNYSSRNDYDANNNVFAKIKNQHPNQVMVMDWKSAVQLESRKYLDNGGIFPSEEGQKLFANLVSSTAGAAKSTVSVCIAGAVDGGLTDDQAQAVADYYNSDEVNGVEWNLPLGNNKRNCVSFTAFFVQRFTSIGKKPQSEYTWDDGRGTAHKLAATFGLESGTTPRPFSVFSLSRGEYGHTGIVVRVDGDLITTLEASYSRQGYNASLDAHIVHYSIDQMVNTIYPDTFTYLDDILNVSELSQIAGGY